MAGGSFGLAGQVLRRSGEGGAEALFPTMYWPGWKATIDGQPAKLRAWPSSGNIALAVPAGKHAVTLELDRTPVRLAAELLSLAAVVATTIMLIGGGRTTGDERQTNRARDDIGNPLPPRFPLLPILFRCRLFVVLSLFLFALLWRGDPDDLPRGDLTWDFAQMGYLNHNPGGIAFTDGAVKKVPLLARIDTLDELDYYRAGGILHYVLRNLNRAA